MTLVRRGPGVVVGLLMMAALAGRADAARSKAAEAREYLDKATAAFALNHYAVAAENYEKAFELKPDPAVLYNAAQAHRLAGNKERALELYQSYLRMYGNDKRSEIEKHIENLKQAIEKDHAVATSPPTTPAPVGGSTAEAAAAAPPAPAPPTPAPAPPDTKPAAPASPESAAAPAPPPATRAPLAPKIMETSPVIVMQPSPPTEEKSIARRPWFWIAIGAVVVAGAVGGFLLLRGDPKDPTASLGTGNGN